MGVMASQITSLTSVYSTVYSGVDQRKHQSSASLAFVLRIHRGPVNSPHKWPVTRKMFPFDDVIMVMWYSLLDFVCQMTLMNKQALWRFFFNDSTGVSWRPKSPANRLFVQQLLRASNRENSCSLIHWHYWCFEMGVHEWPIDFYQKWSVMKKAFLCHDAMYPHRRKYWCVFS